MAHPIRCPQCGFTNPAGGRFCSQCATVLVAAPPIQMVPVQAAPPPGRRVGLMLVIVGLAAIVPIAMIVMMVFVFDGFGSGEVQGEIVSTGEPHGDYTLTPTACFSGEHESFFGAWITPALVEVPEGQGFKGGLKLVKNHTGTWEVFVESPIECESLDCKIRPLAADQCSVFDIEVRNTNTTINDIRVRKGHARLSCNFTEGGSLRTDLTFSGCS